eukprot:11190987-Ditylum_brightwellii.AAC.1
MAICAREGLVEDVILQTVLKIIRTFHLPQYKSLDGTEVVKPHAEDEDSAAALPTSPRSKQYNMNIYVMLPTLYILSDISLGALEHIE